MARARGCTVIVCGSDATDHAEQYLAQGADYVLLGEGEETLAELVDRLEGDQPASVADILGLAYQENGQPRRAARRPDIRDLDSLPFPAWDLVDVERYRQIWLERHGYYSMNMVTTRGCPYHCNWCAKPIWGQRYNVRSPENVAAEMKWLKQQFAPDHIWFADDIMGLKPGWWEAFAALAEQEQLQLPFKCLSRVDLLLRGEAITSLKQAGCDIVWVGAESGSQNILNAMEKGTRVEQIYESTRRLQEAGVKVGFFLQFGYPGETRADIEKTLQMVRDCRPDDIGMSVSYPLPGTPFYERVKVELGEQRNWQDSADLAMMYAGPFATPFYRQLHVVLHKEFRARKSWEELRALWRRPTALRPAHLRRAVGLLYRLATLPLSRHRLEQLAQAPHEGLNALPAGLTLEEAAKPTPQAE
jgi:anaerobic magnesium-protoporphyrin IX monomethyl ester cyclase